MRAGIEPSVGSVGDSYDNALAETINGLYKAEVIHRRGPWRNFEAVEFATLEWVDWFNNRRLLEPIGFIPPAEAEERADKGFRFIPALSADSAGSSALRPFAKLCQGVRDPLSDGEELAKVLKAVLKSDWDQVPRLIDEPFVGRCHVIATTTRSGISVRNFKQPRRPRATWSSPRRVAHGAIERT